MVVQWVKSIYGYSEAQLFVRLPSAVVWTRHSLCLKRWLHGWICWWTWSCGGCIYVRLWLTVYESVVYCVWEYGSISEAASSEWQGDSVTMVMYVRYDKKHLFIVAWITVFLLSVCARNIWREWVSTKTWVNEWVQYFEALLQKKKKTNYFYCTGNKNIT